MRIRDLKMLWAVEDYIPLWTKETGVGIERGQQGSGVPR